MTEVGRNVSFEEYTVDPVGANFVELQLIFTLL